MEKLKPKHTKNNGPEDVIQRAIVAYLEARDWAVITTHGNIFQYGLPDLYCAHYSYGTRWVEVKNPEGFHFTPAQLKTFPLLQSKGVSIWVMTAATDFQYQWLFEPANWTCFLNRSTCPWACKANNSGKH